MESIEKKVLKVIFEAGMVQQLLFIVFPVLALDHPKLILMMVPSSFPTIKFEAAIDHLMLCVKCLLHSGDDVFVWLSFVEGEGVDVIAGDGLEVADFLEDVFGEVLAAWLDDVAFVFEDVGERGAIWVIAQLPLAASFYHVFHFYNRGTLSTISAVYLVIFDYNQTNIYDSFALFISRSNLYHHGLWFY